MDEGLAYGEQEAELKSDQNPQNNMGEALLTEDMLASDIAVVDSSEPEPVLTDPEKESSVQLDSDEDTVVGEGTRDIALEIGPLSSHGDTDHGDDKENDSGTITDDYEADCSDTEPASEFDEEDGEATGGISEMSLTDTIICVGFGYALVYA